jgi:hypothetical protein
LRKALGGAPESVAHYFGPLPDDKDSSGMEGIPTPVNRSQTEGETSWLAIKTQYAAFAAVKE